MYNDDSSDVSHFENVGMGEVFIDEVSIQIERDLKENFHASFDGR